MWDKYDSSFRVAQCSFEGLWNRKFWQPKRADSVGLTGTEDTRQAERICHRKIMVRCTNRWEAVDICLVCWFVVSFANNEPKNFRLSHCVAIKAAFLVTRLSVCLSPLISARCWPPSASLNFSHFVTIVPVNITFVVSTPYYLSTFIALFLLSSEFSTFTQTHTINCASLMIESSMNYIHCKIL